MPLPQKRKNGSWLLSSAYKRQLSFRRKVDKQKGLTIAQRKKVFVNMLTSKVYRTKLMKTLSSAIEEEYFQGRLSKPMAQEILMDTALLLGSGVLEARKIMPNEVQQSIASKSKSLDETALGKKSQLIANQSFVDPVTKNKVIVKINGNDVSVVLVEKNK